MRIRVYDPSGRFSKQFEVDIREPMRRVVPALVSGMLGSTTGYRLKLYYSPSPQASVRSQVLSDDSKLDDIIEDEETWAREYAFMLVPRELPLEDESTLQNDKEVRTTERAIKSLRDNKNQQTVFAVLLTLAIGLLSDWVTNWVLTDPTLSAVLVVVAVMIIAFSAPLTFFAWKRANQDLHEIIREGESGTKKGGEKPAEPWVPQE